MAVDFMPTSKQVAGDFNNGEILELRPVIPPPPSFGHNKPGGFRPYSNLFYWANAWSKSGGTIGLHPHKGFEILSYVVEGNIEHYDTLLRKWIPLHAGSLQIIRSGSGISHSERVNGHARMFQIWLDPDLSVTMREPASYNDYAEDAFPVQSQGGSSRTTVIGPGSPVQLRSQVRMERLHLQPGAHVISIPQGNVLSWFQISGVAQVGGPQLGPNDFVRVREQDTVEVMVTEALDAFLIFSPAEPGYRTYY